MHTANIQGTILDPQQHKASPEICDSMPPLCTGKGYYTHCWNQAYHPWQVLTMDTMSPFPPYNGYCYVLTLVDTYSRFIVVVVVLTKDHTATTTAKILPNIIFPHYGLPLAIHSDNARNYMAKSRKRLAGSAGFTPRTGAYASFQPEQPACTHIFLCSTVASVVMVSWHVLSFLCVFIFSLVSTNLPVSTTCVVLLQNLALLSSF